MGHPSRDARRPLLATLLAMLVFGRADAIETAPPLADWQLHGAAVMRFLGLKVYAIRLWHKGSGYRPDAPFALELEYARHFAGSDIVERSLAEMRDQGWRDEAQLARWRTAMRTVLPDVRAGDRLIGIAIPQVEARFYAGERYLGTVADPAFVAAFFDIWLSEKTSAPRVRALARCAPMTAALPRGRLAAYALSALPLAMLSLPVYLHVPKFYSEIFGLNLAALGGLLLMARLLDAIQDPLLGHLSDTARQHGIQRLQWLWLGVPLLMLGVYALFVPPTLTQAAAGWWLVGASVIVYTALSVVQINYHAHGAELTEVAAERTRITAWREAFALVGILLGASLPAVLAPFGSPSTGFEVFAMIACVLLGLAAFITVRGSPPALPRVAYPRPLRLRDTLSVPLANAGFRRLLLVYVCNGTAAAVPATLVLFFIEDVLGSHALTAHFLVTYFAAGALGMPLWPWLAGKIGKARAWGFSMLAAIAVFAWAATLQAGDVVPFFAICALSGLSLGADLALPPALLADVIERGTPSGEDLRSGSYFGLWALVTKLNLALAAGIALPLVAFLGYLPHVENTARGVTALSVCYALLPSGLKLLAVLCLWRSPMLFVAYSKIKSVEPIPAQGQPSCH